MREGYIRGEESEKVPSAQEIAEKNLKEILQKGTTRKEVKR